MPDPVRTSDIAVALSGNDWMRLACAFWSNRLAQLLGTVLPEESGQAGKGVRFLLNRAEAELDDLGWRGFPEAEEALRSILPPDSPLGRVAGSYQWSATDISLVLLAGLAEAHEGYADVLRLVNPEQRPRTATGLAAQLLSPDGDRGACEYALTTGAAVRQGALRLEGDGPLFTRHIVLADGLWPVFNGIDAWPHCLPRRPVRGVPWGLDEWSRRAECRRAQACLNEDRDIAIRLHANTPDAAMNRAVCLAGYAKREASVFSIDEKTPAATIQLSYLHCLARGAVPVFAVDGPRADPQAPLRLPGGFPGAMLIVSTSQSTCEVVDKPLTQRHIEGLSAAGHAQVWSSALPALGESSIDLAARFPVEPHVAAEIANDLAHLERVTPADVGRQIRARAGGLSKAGIDVVIPKADWSQLVLPPEQALQLRESVERLNHQARVLNQWGFLESRSGAGGVRVLLAGPSGTGKTLSAEVLAHELGVDLLVIDISRVVSKWIGETEKNLEQAFEAAEQSKAVLLFDEADALFGKRTEVTDAHDRYANLETAYLLTRLERFEGLAIMSTNMRDNIDPAFLRRMEYIVDFSEPDRAERLAIWRCHVPERAPMDTDVDFAELAAMFPVVGGTIRNAAVAAAFRAASRSRAICRGDFVHALRREYEKQGKAFPASTQAKEPPAP